MDLGLLSLTKFRRQLLVSSWLHPNKNQASNLAQIVLVLFSLAGLTVANSLYVWLDDILWLSVGEEIQRIRKSGLLEWVFLLQLILHGKRVALHLKWHVTDLWGKHHRPEEFCTSQCMRDIALLQCARRHCVNVTIQLDNLESYL